MSSSAPGSSCNDRATGAVANPHGAFEYLAAMVEEGWLDGLVERRPTAQVKAVFVQTISATGRRELTEILAYSVGAGGLQTLGEIARRSESIDAAHEARLRTLGLVLPSDGVSHLGTLMLTARGRQSAATGAAVIQSVRNVHIAIGASRIVGNVSVPQQPLDCARTYAPCFRGCWKRRLCRFSRGAEEIDILR